MAWFIRLVLLVAIAASAAPAARSQTDGSPRPLSAALSFVDGAGRAVSTADFAGKWLFVYLGYMHCADQCPLGLTVMGQAVDDIGGAARHVQPLFVTVDPERDHGQALAQFATSFHEHIIGLTGSPAQIEAAANALGVVFRKAGEGSDYTVDHSSSYSLINPERTTVITFKHAEAHLVASRIIATMIRGGTDLSGIAGIGAFR